LLVDCRATEACAIMAHNPFSRLLRVDNGCRARLTELHKAKVRSTGNAHGTDEPDGQAVDQIARLQRGGHIVAVGTGAHYQHRNSHLRQALWRKAAREPQI